MNFLITPPNEFIGPLFQPFYKAFALFWGICILVLISFLSGCSAPPASLPHVSPQQPQALPNEVIHLSPQGVEQAGISLVTITARKTITQLGTTGEVKANENRVFHVSSLVSGRIAQDFVLLGDVVQKNQVLGTLQNLEVVKANAEYIHQIHQNELDIRQAKTRLALANQNLARERKLLEEGISPRKDYYQAQTDAVLAQSTLAGLQEHRIHIEAEGKALLGAYGVQPNHASSEKVQSVSPIVAPRAGIITQKTITMGDVVTPDKILYEVADLSQVWLDLAIYPKDLTQVRLGQMLQFKSDSLPGKTFRGHINYLPPAANPVNQTFTARAYLNNPNGELRPGMFGQAVIFQGNQQWKPFIPESALQEYGKETFVFKVAGPQKFKKQLVELGSPISGGYLVNSGLQFGDRVVSQGSFVLKAALLKNSGNED